MSGSYLWIGWGSIANLTGRRDRVVVAGLSMPENTLCDDVVAIDGEFEGVADIGVVEGRPASRS